MICVYVTVTRRHNKLLQKMTVSSGNIPPAGGPYPYVLSSCTFPISLTLTESEGKHDAGGADGGEHGAGGAERTAARHYRRAGGVARRGGSPSGRARRRQVRLSPIDGATAFGRCGQRLARAPGAGRALGRASFPSPQVTVRWALPLTPFPRCSWSAVPPSSLSRPPPFAVQWRPHPPPSLMFPN
jgi:hypothetical protein